MKSIHQLVYGALGAVFVALGSATVLGIGPADPDAEMAHVTRELAAAGIFIGLMCFWCVANYSRRRYVHLSLLLFAFLIAVIHWADHFRGLRPLQSGLVNSVPFLALLLMTGRGRASKSG